MPSMEWDLNLLVPKGFEDPKIDESITFAKQMANELEKTYRGKIKDLTAKEIEELVSKEEEIYIKTSEVNQFARLHVSANSNNMDALKLVNKLQVVNTEIAKQLTFMDLELGDLLKNNPDIIEDPTVADIKYYLEKTRHRALYRLSESEEQIIMEKNLYGRNEWSRLQGQWLSKKKFPIEINGEIKEMGWGQGVSLLSHPDHAVRKEAVEKLFSGLEQDREMYAFALRNVCSDTITEYKRRGYPDYMESAFMSSNINKAMFEAMITTVEANVDLFQEFLLLQAKMLGTEKLRGEDLYAPSPYSDDREISWEEATNMIINGYSEFDEEFGEIARDMVESNRIDSKPRDGKRGGAFCSTDYNAKKAFIFQSFSGTLDNVGTLAHEMGHAVHAYLSSRSQRPNNQFAGMSLAESASEFGTMMFTEKFLKEAPTDEAKIAILHSALSGLMTSIFEVSSRTRIEQKLYEAIDNGELLSPDRITQAFWEGRKIYFGDVVDWNPKQGYEWCFKGHYYISGLRFYNFPYVFGELLVLSLYAQYKKDGDAFKPKYKEYLSAGGSKSAEDLAAIFGFDFADTAFWENGISEMRRMLDELKSLLK
ncbi:MAG: hypothetical protein INQ03_17360 [Candidatus Heimdallarchaeota archaeon]|nr:hypothetical protein [Candidatus Heimdallarchaeota archaeon]